MDDLYKKFPAALTAAREAAGLTQKELGDRVGKTQQAVAKWENGESRPTRRSMGQLIAVLPSLANLGLPALSSVAVQNQDTHSQRADDGISINRPRALPPRAALARVGRPLPQPRSMQVMKDIYEALPPELQGNFKQSQGIDYESSKAAVEISVPASSHMRPLILESQLWRLTTALRQHNDARWYYLLLVPAEETQEARDLNFQRMIARYTSEAAVHGIVFLVADNAAHAAQIITEIENGNPDSTTDELFYDDEEPHG